MASICNIPISLTSLPSLSKSKFQFSQNPSSLSLSTKPIPFHSTNNRKKKNSSKLWITLATPQEVLPSDSTPLEQTVSTTGDEGVANVIQALLFVAFVALTILTVGVYT
ncbi:uncharacterized protein LOC120116359 [Hibiscus syriacus]|uniref:uncharacterized protein LOC120116359 n=1 Tax=Hibiscus syriacus TaxID=106335 RepID=UPI001923CE77|nr:uncharacterized protein LOC120116359 [Hibiscus syriacus]